MDKLEKVIKGLEVCFDSSKECSGCPYIDTPYCRTTLRNDVTVLLKEQQEKIDGLFEDLATAIDDKDSALLTLNECDTVEHALSVLRKHGWKETDDVPYPVELLKEQNGLTLALEQANATINYLNEEKENAIKEIEERKAFNLKCDGQPEWLRKGIDVGLNTALDILKGKDGEQE